MKDQYNFYEKCHKLLCQIPEGKVTTYGEIAKALGSGACRAVGTAMAKNDKLVIRPCHRLVKSDGRIGEYALGPKKKEELLKKEGVEVANGRVINFDKYFYKFSA
jgi:methylated-DNA-[protein]-cysteine S-methyltransferase